MTGWPGISEPLQGARLVVLSLGAGVQSSTLALMAARGEIGPMPHCAIFADTQSEPAGVYLWLAWLETQLPFPVHHVTAGSLAEQILTGQKVNGRPPLFVRNLDGSVGMTRRQCTSDFKLDPIRKKVRELIGLKPRTRGPKTPVVEQWVGISKDEIQRMKLSRDRYIYKRHPLIELGMTRANCLEWMAARQYPQPPKSACTFCPYHDDPLWRDLKENDAPSFAQAVAVDVVLRSGRLGNLRGSAFLHRTCQPLARGSGLFHGDRTNRANRIPGRM